MTVARAVDRQASGRNRGEKNAAAAAAAAVADATADRQQCVR